MGRYFTKTFVRFFIGFVLIVGAAFGVLALAQNLVGPSPVDSLAAPR